MNLQAAKFFTLSSGTKGEAKTHKRTWLRVVLSAIPLAMLVWIGWNFRPWMPEGRAVYLGDAHFGNHDFQVWQRKNSFIDATEPFATALFVRKRGAGWKFCLLDFEDTYRPSVNLREENSGVAILYGKTKWGYFDEERDVFVRYHYDGGSTVFEGIVIDSEPPDDGWQRLSQVR